jgi:hypothetical protein
MEKKKIQIRVLAKKKKKNSRSEEQSQKQSTKRLIRISFEEKTLLVRNFNNG